MDRPIFEPPFSVPGWRAATRSAVYQGFPQGAVLLHEVVLLCFNFLKVSFLSFRIVLYLKVRSKVTTLWTPTYFFLLRNYMEASDKLHGAVVSPLVVSRQEAECVPGPVWTWWRRKPLPCCKCDFICKELRIASKTVWTKIRTLRT
jgi:hypothetical protein